MRHTSARSGVTAKKPESIDFAEAAALSTPGLTALDLVDAVNPKELDTVLVVGATGGVGSYAVQLAARRGARVIATARQANEAFVRELGVAETIDHTAEDIVGAVLVAHPDGIDAIIDVVSAPTCSTAWLGSSRKAGDWRRLCTLPTWRASQSAASGQRTSA